MTKKIIFTIIIAVVLIAAMIIYKDTMTPLEVILSLLGSSSTVVAVWNWFSKEEVKTEFKNKVGVSYNFYRKRLK